MRRILPEPAAEVSVLELLGELRPWEHAQDGKPYVSINFALTLDGHSTLGGVSRGIGSERDTEMLVGLRMLADAVLIGAGTMRAERYGRLMADPKKQDRREEMGLSRIPLLAITSGGLDLPWDAPIFEEEEAKIVIFTSSSESPPQTAALIEVVRHEGRVDLREALAHLNRERGVRALLCEGGAVLHGELHMADRVDEIFVAHAPKLVGGRGPGLAEGLNPLVRELDLGWLVHEPETGELFARYLVRREGRAEGG